MKSMPEKDFIEQNYLPSLFKGLFKQRKLTDYDRLVYNIRLISHLLCSLLNILNFITTPAHSGEVASITFALQCVYLAALVCSKNDYLPAIVFQISSVIQLTNFRADTQNAPVLPTAILITFIVYSLQFFPLAMNIVFAAVNVHVTIQHRRSLEKKFDYDNDFINYIKFGGDAWISAGIVLFFIINAFQIYNAKVWKAFTVAKQEIIEKNQELHQANQKMEQMVQNLKEINQKLELTNKNLSEALQHQDLFVACVSHELRTPLNAMIGNIELLQLETTDPVKKKMLKTCQICGEILLVMINNILDVAKINASKLEINISAMSIPHFIEKIWNVSCPKILQKDLYGKLFISEDVPLWLKGDFHRLIQIIINLVGNATKFTSKGGVKVLLSWENDIIGNSLTFEDKERISHSIHEEVEASIAERCSFAPQLSTEANHVNEVFRLPSLSFHMDRLNHEKWIMFSEKDDDFSLLQQKLNIQHNKKGMLKIQVIDTGCGIPQDAHSRIFEPFVQADASITRNYGGSGLGLYIIKELLNKMNGTITVSSEANKGAKFTIRMPLSTISSEEVLHPKEALSSGNMLIPKKTKSPVLIVDDSHYNQHILKTYLDNLGIPSETADNGLEALNKIKAQTSGYYSMIMMDIQMPVMDGITVSKRIRQHEKECKLVSSRGVPIIMITANCTSAEQNECMAPNGEIRATYFFRKPFSFSDCKLSVETILSRKHTKPKKVLVIDDDAFNRELLQTQIKKLGLVCETCKNGFEALQKLKDDAEIALVLTDFEMPIMDGIELVRRIRQQLKLEEIYIIGITGNVEKELNKLSLINRMNKILTKPVGLDQISCLFKEYNLI